MSKRLEALTERGNAVLEALILGDRERAVDATRILLDTVNTEREAFGIVVGFSKAAAVAMGFENEGMFIEVTRIPDEPPRSTDTAVLAAGAIIPAVQNDDLDGARMVWSQLNQDDRARLVFVIADMAASFCREET